MDCINFFNIYLGDDISQPLGVDLNGDPVNLTSVDEIVIQFPLDPSTNPPSPLFTASKTNGKITVLDAVLGKITLLLASADTANFQVQEGLNIDIVITISGKQSTYRLPNGCNIRKRSPN